MSVPISILRHPSHHRSWLEVNLSTIQNNIRRFQELVGSPAGVMPEIKADAYGHGAVAVGRAALEVGCERLVVATVLEGEELRAAGIEAPIHILGSSLPQEIPHALANNLTLSVHEMESPRLISRDAVKRGITARVHLKIDTGMGRLGILPEDAAAAAVEISALPNMEIEALFMHFADAGDEPYSHSQLARFHDACTNIEAAGVRVPFRHAASSAAAVLYPEAHFDMIRPGAGMYGYFSPAWVHDRCPVEPALTWRCVVIQVKDYPPGLSLGYNRTFTTRRPTRIAVLPVGYADGYLLGFSNKCDVLIAGRRAPVVGMISMDYAMVDVTDLQDVAVGTVVTLIGKDGGEEITTEELADHADTIPYIITTCLGRRPGRCYVVDEGEARRGGGDG